MITITPRPHDIPITDYTVDAQPVSIPFRFRVGAVVSHIMDAVGTILSYGRLLLHHVGRRLLFLVQVPFRLLVAVRSSWPVSSRPRWAYCSCPSSCSS